jgi:uncharacterized phage protein (TIGR01671 family)
VYVAPSVKKNNFEAKIQEKENPKHVFSESWVEGNLILCNGKAYIHPISNKVAVKGELGKIIVMHEVIPDTICRYTGLEDKNGKEIWENDIVRNEKGDIGVVQWFEEHAAFMIWNKTKHYLCYLAENDFSKIEIAGNEFDNPELLEVEQ